MAKHKPNKGSPHTGGRLAKRVEPNPGNGTDSPAPNPSPPSSRNVVLLCLLLALVVLGAFLPSVRSDFINLDDGVYVTKNFHVQAGLSWENFKWSFYSTEGGNYWHPLTWLSHMMDCQIFGLKPWGHHLTSVLIHAVNTLLVFLVFRGLTGALWRSFVVAALFGLHPLHVESVAWVAERKDVLSAFFWLLTMWAYGKYTKGFKVQGSKFKVYYALALLFFALGLMSKPMVVTLPFVLLLLDYWPLRRSAERGMRSAEFKTEALPQALSWARLVIEKIPFFALAAAASVAAYMVQKGGGAIWMNLPVGARVENTPISYVRYLGKMFWPANLAVFYPHPGHWPMAAVLLSALLLAGITVAVFLARRRDPYLLVGWLWFMGSLVPVIGLVQVGEQAMADRYSYIPFIGLFVSVVWGLSGLTSRWPYRTAILTAAAVIGIALCAGLTREQIGYWKNSETLFGHAIAVTKNNHLAHGNLGLALYRKGDHDAAVRELEEAIRLNSSYAPAHFNLGVALTNKRRLDEAISQFQAALSWRPQYAEAHNGLGVALLNQGRVDEAMGQFEQAIKLKPGYVDAHCNLGLVLGGRGRRAEAIAEFTEALRLQPDYPQAEQQLRALSGAALH